MTPFDQTTPFTRTEPRTNVRAASDPTFHVRSTAMSFMYEELSRARHRQLVAEAEHARRVRALVQHRRWQKRAERAALRARLALAAVV